MIGKCICANERYLWILPDIYTYCDFCHFWLPYIIPKTLDQNAICSKKKFERTKSQKGRFVRKSFVWIKFSSEITFCPKKELYLKNILKTEQDTFSGRLPFCQKKEVRKGCVKFFGDFQIFEWDLARKIFHN